MRNKLIVIAIIIILAITASFFFLKKTINKQIPKEFNSIEIYSYKPRQLENIVNEHKKYLWELNISYQKKYQLNLFGLILNAYENNWASDRIIAHFLNSWFHEANIHNNQILKSNYAVPPYFSIFLFNIKINNRNEIKKLPSFTNNFLEKAKEKYLKSDNNSFFKWSKYQAISANKKNKEISTKLFEAISLATDNLNSAITANIMLVQSLDNGIITLQDKLNYVANIARYSAVMNKVSSNARNCIINYKTLLNKYPSVKKDFDKDIKQQCIIDVVKKYDLLTGKPKDGYYYPVNDMKIKVVAD